MKRILVLLMIMLCVGCTQSADEETPVATTPSVIATEPVEETTTPATSEPTIDTATAEPTTEVVVDNSTSSEVTEDGFKTVSISGLFDIQVRDPLPEQMELEINEQANPDGSQWGTITLTISSSDSNCSVASSCRFYIYSFWWYTEEALEYDSQHDMIASDDNLVHEYETSVGRINVYRYYPAQIAASIDDGNGPDYYYDTAGGQLTYAVEDLIRFDKE